MADTNHEVADVNGKAPMGQNEPQAASAEIIAVPDDSSSNLNQKKSGPRPPTRQQQLDKLYSLPAPLRTFPLPTLVPHNPLSLLHLLYVWVSQTINPGRSHIEPLYQGWFSPETRSVHVTDQRCIRGLWEQGFYGKGSLSRSEPSWHKRETTKLGSQGQITAEERTRQRRAERQQTKWERARKEREAIEQKLVEEAKADAVWTDPPAIDPLVENGLKDPPASVAATSQIPKFAAPVGPLELLALPDSLAELEASSQPTVIACTTEDVDHTFVEPFYKPPVGPLELLALPDRLPPYSLPSSIEPVPSTHSGHVVDQVLIESRQNGVSLGSPSNVKEQSEDGEIVGGSETNEDTAEGSTHSEDTEETASTTPNGSAMANGTKGRTRVKRSKSVRFSPTVEKNTFLTSDPPSPQLGEITTPTLAEEPLVVVEQEHTQLTLEEAFFLSYGLGALQVFDPQTRAPIPNEELFSLFRQTSYFPPVANQTLSSDDPFLLNYVVYHHYRSLGWVPRGGIKFSVDLMLYVRGPVFTHAEYGVLILPSYSDPYWTSDVFRQKYVKSKEQRTWHWLSCINRVITQVKKTLILTYVDIPPPLDKAEEEKLGIDKVLARYKVREVVLKRWVANRSRD